MDTSGGKVDSDKAQTKKVQPDAERSGQQSTPTTPQQPSAEEPSVVVGRPAGAKEEEFVSGVGVSEKVPIVERREPRELPEEVAGWLERVEHDEVAEPKPIVHEGKTVVAPAAPADVEVTLPLTEEEVKRGLHHKIAESIRWLAQWCARLIDKYKGKVEFKIKK